MDDKFYGRHLAKVNDVNGVTATQDIRNDQGQMLLPAGQALNHQAIDKIVKFKLLKPLENCIAINSQLDSKSLYSSFESLILSNASTSIIFATTSRQEELLRCCEEVEQFPLVMQKLTVLKSQFPTLFHKALYCAWFAMNIYIQNGESPNDIKDAFIAGLMHDIGMLHLNPDFVESERRLEPEEWRQLQAHPLISLQVVKNIPGLSPNVCSAVAEHHESIDGTGYPAAKVAKQICSLAQILHLLDSTYAIFEKHFKPRNRTLCDLVPIIQMNQHYRYNPNASVLIVLFKYAKPTIECFTPPELIDSLIDYVTQKNNYVIQFLKVSVALNKLVGFQHNEKKLIGLQNILLHIHICLARSGLINSAYIESLKQTSLDGTEQAHREIEDASIMLSEIIHHCDKLKIYLGLYLQECKDQKNSEEIAAIGRELNLLVRPQTTANFSNYMMDLNNATTA